MNRGSNQLEGGAKKKPPGAKSDMGKVRVQTPDLLGDHWGKSERPCRIVEDVRGAMAMISIPSGKRNLLKKALLHRTEKCEGGGKTARGIPEKETPLQDVWQAIKGLHRQLSRAGGKKKSPARSLDPINWNEIKKKKFKDGWKRELPTRVGAWTEGPN